MIDKVTKTVPSLVAYTGKMINTKKYNYDGIKENRLNKKAAHKWLITTNEVITPIPFCDIGLANSKKKDFSF